MRALVTGGAGFIGSHLTDELLKRDYTVAVLDNLSTGRRENLAHLAGHPRFQLVVGDVLDLPLLDGLIARCDVVFHLAAAVGVQLVVKNPWTCLTSNIRCVETILEAACRHGKKILITSSSEIYGKNTNVPLKEEDDRILGSPLKSRWAYSTSKAVGEMLAYFYWREKQLPTIIVRLFNTIGPRQTGAYGMVIPRLIDQALRGEPLTIFGSGTQTRCFIHVRDTVEGLICLMEHPLAPGDVFNIGSQQEVSMTELAQRVVAVTGSASPIVRIPYDQAYEPGFEDMPRRVPDTSKIKALTGFQVRYSLDEILREVSDYCRGLPGPATPEPDR